MLHILDEYDAEIGISVLVHQSLMTVDNNIKLEMHDLLQDMGKKVVHEKSPKQLEECSRLWLQKDVLDLLSKHICLF